MEDSYKALRDLFEELKKDIPTLQKRLGNVYESIQKGFLVDEASIEALRAVLTEYQRVTMELRTAGEQLSITLAPRIKGIEAQIRSLEVQQEALQLLKIIHTYFRLKAANDDIGQILEETKRKLMEKCVRASEALDAELRPYAVVIAKVQKPARVLSDEEFELISKDIALKIARAVDCGQLSIDAEADISVYLDSSCKWLSAEETEGVVSALPMDKNADTSHEADNDMPGNLAQPLETIINSALPRDEEEIFARTEEEQTDVIEGLDDADEFGIAPEDEKCVDFDAYDDVGPLWENYDGYLQENASVELAKDTPAAQLSSKVFERHLRKTQGMICGALHVIAKEKLCSDEGIDDPEMQFSSIPPDTLDNMTHWGYLRKLELREGDVSKSFWSLSAMGWACFTKKEIADRLRKMKCHYSPSQKSAVDDWDTLTTARYAMLYKYMLAARKEYFANNIHCIVFGYIHGDGATVYLPALFVRGGEDVTALCEFMETGEENTRIVIIVRSREDAEKLADFFAQINDCAEETWIPLHKIDYVLENDPDQFFRPVNGPAIASEEVLASQTGTTQTSEGFETESDPEKEAGETPEADKIPEAEETPDTEETPETEQMPEVEKTPKSEKMSTEEEMSEIEASTAMEKPPRIETDVAEYFAAEVNSTPAAENARSNDAARVRQYLEGAWHMQLKGRTDVAAVMLQYLAEREPEVKTLAEQFAYATGDPAKKGVGNSNDLQEAFNLPAGDDATMDALAVAAYLRMYFSAAAGEQTYLSRDMSHQKENSAMKRCPKLKEALFNLADWVRYQHRGLDAKLIERLLQNHNAGMKQRELQIRAQGLLDRRLTESSHGDKRIKCNRDILFGKGSEISLVLNAIKANDDETGIRQLAESWVGKDIDAVIDDAWRKATSQIGFARNENCTGKERKTLYNQIKSVQELFREWLDVNSEEDHTINEQQVKDAEQRINQLRPMLEAALDELSAPDKTLPLAQRAAESALAGAIRDCLERINGEATQEEQERDYYIELLKEPLIALEDLKRPHIEMPEEETEPFDFCRRAMGYLDAQERSWEDVLQRIFSIGPGREGMDYGCAEVLRTYLDLTDQKGIWKEDYSIETAVRNAENKASTKSDSVNLWERDLMARMEMADGDNWFDGAPALREHILHVAEAQKAAYYHARNYGFYGRAIMRLLDLLHKKAQGLRPKYRAAYAKLIDGRGEEEKDQPVFEQISKMIENDRFGAAESIMQQVRSGNLTIGNGELTSTTLRNFLDAINSNLYRLAKLDNKKKTLTAVYTGMHKRISNATQSSGERLIKAWPEGGTLQPEKVRNMFMELDQQVSHVTGQGAEVVVHLVDKGIVMDYPHPFAAFGSVMDKKGIDVVLINGKRDAEGLKAVIGNILQRNHSGRPLLLLVNGAITVDERRKLAKHVSRFADHRPFLLLDRCLALYLADTPKTDRWKMLLRCALPFRVINPYFESSSTRIPPDMFIGRRKEMHDIIAPEGPNLLYGGRQLGKTAILQRVQYQQNRPDDGAWAVYVDIRDKDHAEAVDTIMGELRANGFLPPAVKATTWDELVKAIKSRLMDAPESRDDTLLLMMDEADNILKLFETDNYRTLGEMKELQQTANGRFKFVFAGLHNVLRFSKMALGGNSVLPHLGGITIQPMKFSDARELLEVPLSYLGFTIEAGQEDIIAQILHSTNYFPGLIHFYAKRLVEHMQEISSPVTAPPYALSRGELLRMIGDESFRMQRRDKLMMTLRVDEKEKHAYYYTLAYALAMLNHDSEDALLHGASAAEVRDLCCSWEKNCRIGELSNQQVEALLDELVTLNILRKEEKNGVHFYMFSRSSFLEMLGTEEDVINNLMEALDSEERQK